MLTLDENIIAKENSLLLSQNTLIPQNNQKCVTWKLHNKKSMVSITEI
jgi:hypothetical protein